MAIDEHSRPKVTLRSEPKSAVATMNALRNPPAGVNVQIVLASNGYTNFHDREMLDVFGLGFRLDPPFFSNRGDEIFHRKSTVAEYEDRVLLPEYFRLAGTVIAVVRNCCLSKKGSPPILFIDGLQCLKDAGPLYYLIRKVPSILNPTEDEDLETIGLFLRLLEASLERYPECTKDCESLLFSTLIPLLQVEMLRMQSTYARIFTDLEAQESAGILDDGGMLGYEGSGDLSSLYRGRSLLRALTVKFENTTDSFHRELHRM